MSGGGNLPPLGGPIFLFFVGVLLLGGILAIFVVLDSLLRWQRGRYLAREPWWVYTVPQGLYLLVLFAAQFPFVPNWGGAVVFLLTPLAIAEAVAYLLRVVFPKPAAQSVAEAPDAARAAGEAARAAETDADQPDAADAAPPPPAEGS